MIKKLLYLFVLLLFGCTSNKKLVDKIILNNQNTQTGRIIQCDSAAIVLEKTDQSVQHLLWKEIDTVVGIRYKTPFLAFNTSFSKVPYFSVFRNEDMNPNTLGFHFKYGVAKGQKNLRYVQFAFFPASPYGIRKFGIGTQRYFKGTYLSPKTFFFGADVNLLSADYNNSAQFSLEPFIGFEKIYKERFRINGKLNFQFNLANKNQSTGLGIQLGCIYLLKDIHKRYRLLNTTHSLPEK